MIKVDGICCIGQRVSRNTQTQEMTQPLRTVTDCEKTVCHDIPRKPVMIAPAEAITIVDVRMEVDILEVLKCSK